jgi:membrane protein DedA with SNARE-associated domain
VAWAAGIGLGAYFAGPPIEDLASDIGWVITVGIVALVLVGVRFEVRRRLRRGRRHPGTAEPPTGEVVPPGAGEG